MNDSDPSNAPASTADASYAARLERLEGARWKRALDVQRPYRWNIRRLCTGFTLDVGCGIGRNLAHLRGNGVGVDHNAAAIATARARGLTAFTTDGFAGSAYDRPGRFDHLLLAHVVEHCSMHTGQIILLTKLYAPTTIQFYEDAGGLAVPKY